MRNGNESHLVSCDHALFVTIRPSKTYFETALLDCLFHLQTADQCVLSSI